MELTTADIVRIATEDKGPDGKKLRKLIKDAAKKIGYDLSKLENDSRDAIAAARLTRMLADDAVWSAMH